jgi:hypothetical protein
MTNDDTSLNALDKGDLARILHKSERTVDRLRRAGILPEPLTPGHPRWSRTVIERWLEGAPVGRRRT